MTFRSNVTSVWKFNGCLRARETRNVAFKFDESNPELILLQGTQMIQRSTWKLEITFSNWTGQVWLQITQKNSSKPIGFHLNNTTGARHLFWAQITNKQTYLHPVGEPVAFRVRALHCEQNIASRDDASLWHCLDFNGQVSVVLL